jgi:hypothetical protein
MIHSDHPPYSPDLSPGDFWLLGALKNRMKETVFRSVYEVCDFVYSFWCVVTLDEVQPAFHQWMRRLNWVCEHDGESVPE